VSANGTEYLLAESSDPAAVAAVLAEHLGIDAGRARTVTRTFYDTFDGRLHRKGLVLVHEDRRLVLRDDAHVELASAEQRQRPARLLQADLADARLRELLHPVIDVRALSPTVRITSRVRPMSVLNSDAKTVVRLAVEESQVDGLQDDAARLRARVHVSPVRGYDKALDRVRRTLERQIGLAPAQDPVHDEAVRATGGIPGGTSSKLRISLSADQRADSATALLLVHLQATIEHNLPGTLAAADSEFLHDLRVAVRRTRSALRQLKGVFPPPQLEHFRTELRRLQHVTGPTRDLDVYVEELETHAAGVSHQARADLEPLRRLLADHRRREQRRMVRELRSDRTAMLLADWSRFLEGLVVAPQDDRPHADRPIATVAGRRIDVTYRNMVTAGSVIDDDSPAESLHDLRKTGKELRYLLEFFADLYPDDVVAPMITTLKALQDSLGRFQDREVQATVLRSLGHEVAALPDGPAALLAMGLLMDRLEREQAQARAEFSERFAAFADASQRKLVKRTFR
jgi:CHAD domain-containing protein